MVYLDYNATTPLAEEALDAMLPFLRDGYGNPSSIHSSGRMARAGLDDAREYLGDTLGVRSHEIIFTGGGTESCNLAAFGLARAHAMKGRHLITAATEHHAVLHAFEYLANFEGYHVTVLPVDRSGRVDPEEVKAAIRPETTLVSIMHANNETGILQPVAEIGAICREKKVFFHTDAVQTFGKIPVNPAELGVTALSVAGHKFYGPKGTGALYLRSGVALTRNTQGGAQENTRRAGTENVAAVVGLAAAAAYALDKGAADQSRQAFLRDELWAGIQQVSLTAQCNTDFSNALANTLNVSFPGIDGESLIIGLDLEGVCVSSGSACMVGSLQPSHVLLAMGIDASGASSAVRFSLGTQTTREDIQQAIRAVQSVLARQAPRAAA